MFLQAALVWSPTADRAMRQEIGPPLTYANLRLLQERVKRFHGQIGLSQYRTECSAVEFFVIRDHKLRERLIPTQNDMGTVLTFLVKTSFGKRLNAFTA